MAERTPYEEDPEFRAQEQAIGRRRLVAASLTVLALLGLAGGSAAAAFASAADDRVDGYQIGQGFHDV